MLGQTGGGAVRLMHEKESNRPTISRKEDATFFREMKGSRIILAQIDHVFFCRISLGFSEERKTLR